MNPLFWIGAVFSLAIGVGFWYIYYSIECALNGGNIGRSPYLMAFQCAWQEFTWLLPGGTRRKMAACNNDPDWFAMMPGFWHFLLNNVLLPLSPFLFFLFVYTRQQP